MNVNHIGNRVTLRSTFVAKPVVNKINPNVVNVIGNHLKNNLYGNLDSCSDFVSNILLIKNIINLIFTINL